MRNHFLLRDRGSRILLLTPVNVLLFTIDGEMPKTNFHFVPSFKLPQFEFNLPEIKF